MLREKKCIICGKNFETEYPNKRYCSLVCKDAASRMREMKFKAENPDYYKEYMKNYYDEHKDYFKDYFKEYYNNKKKDRT